MAKKRKASGRSSTGTEPQSSGKLGPINTYEDIADSEDEFHINRDKVLLDEAPDAKRRRKWQEEGVSLSPGSFKTPINIMSQDAELEPSDEEVLGYSSDSSDDAPQNAASDFEGENEAQEDEEEETWGASRKDYYNADTILTEAEAQAEETEARRIQQKRLQKLTDADFGFDEAEWLAPESKAEDEGENVVEVLKDVQVTADMGPEERLAVLRIRYPEFEMLANEFLSLQPVMAEMQLRDQVGVDLVKARALAAYLASLGMYFALLTSPATMDPAELHDHVVMDSLLQCRELWTKVKSLKAPSPAIAESDSDSDSSPEEISTKTPINALPPPLTSATAKFLSKAKAAQNFSDLDALLPSRKPKKTIFQDHDAPSTNDDFGEESHLTTADATQKASRKKTLKFYTSQIAQKANKRTGAGRDAGGDEDLPYKERLRDRVARLNAEAEKRGKKLDSYGRGAELDGGDEDEGEKAVAREVRGGEDDEYYDLVNASSKQKKTDKAALIAAAATAHEQNALLRVVEGEMDEEGKRAIGYVIEKNKGLAPRRKKDVRNPRVKKRKKFEEKKKKLGSMKAVYKGGEERGGYGGEKTGIKSGLVKSVKL